MRGTLDGVEKQIPIPDKWLAQEPGNYRRAIRKGDFKLLYDHTTGQREVFDLSPDPTEQRALTGEEGPLAKVLWHDLQAFMEGKRQVEETIDLTDEEKQELEDLGYF